MTVRDALQEGNNLLKNNNIDLSFLECSLLLAESMAITKEKLFASFPDQITDSEYSVYMEYISKRLDGHPIAYILKKKEFFGLQFYIEEGVLCPRPDTELLVETVLSLSENNKNIKSVLDLCTGTGCISISIKANRSDLIISASDISPVSEIIFSKNNTSLVNNSINFTKSSLFEKIEGTFDIIVTNPPYLTSGETKSRMEEGWKEPKLALDGGEDGLDLIRTIISKAPEYLNKNGLLLIEAHPAQMEAMKKDMMNNGFTDIIILKDLPGLDRVIQGTKG